MVWWASTTRVVAGIALAVVVFGETPALAEVRLSPQRVVEGSSVTFRFDVEDERPAARMFAVFIVPPADLLPETITASGPPGYVESRYELPTTIVLRNGGLLPDGPQTFSLTVNHVPPVDELVFQVVVQYDDGTRDRWIEAQAGDALPARPTLVVDVTRQDAAIPRAAPAEGHADEVDSRIGFVAIASLVVAVIALVVARARRPRPRRDLT